MQIETLRAFVELSDAGSFYRAAKHLHVSQQGLNKAISSLEREIGLKFFERDHKGVRLTINGEIFLTHAQRLLEEYASMLDDLYGKEQRALVHHVPLVVHVTYYPAKISRPFVNALDAMDAVSIVEEPFDKLVAKAEHSNGQELYLADIHHPPQEILKFHSTLVFEPLFISQLGIVWKEGSPLAGQRVIHRESLADLPLAVDSHKELLNLIDSVMEHHPLNNIRLGVADPRINLEFANKSSEGATTFDSFGFMLAQDDPTIDTDQLHFTPLSTPRSLCQVGFLYPKQAKPDTCARYAIDKLSEYLHDTYPDYFERYPLE